MWDVLASWPWPTIVAVIGASYVARLNLAASKQAGSSSKHAENVAAKLEKATEMIDRHYVSQAKHVERLTGLLEKAQDSLAKRP